MVENCALGETRGAFGIAYPGHQDGMADDAMNPKQSRFVAEYLKDSNATQAAIRAGYSAKTAGSQGHALLKNHEISSAIHKRSDRIADKAFDEAQITRGWIVERLVRNYEAAFAGQPVVDRYGKPTGQNIQKIGDANKALELLGKTRSDVFVEAKQADTNVTLILGNLYQMVQGRTANVVDARNAGIPRLESERPALAAE